MHHIHAAVCRVSTRHSQEKVPFNFKLSSKYWKALILYADMQPQLQHKRMGEKKERKSNQCTNQSWKQCGSFFQADLDNDEGEIILHRTRESNFQAILSSLTIGQCLDRQNKTTDCSGGGQVFRIITHRNIKECSLACPFFVAVFYLFLSSSFLFFYSCSPLPLSIHCRLMHLTNHWARKGINSYSKQRAIMGTLVVRKLRIFKPARRCAGITEHLYTLFSKHSLGQAWKERGGRDFNWQDKARRGGLWGGLFPGCTGIGPCFWNS